MQEQSWEGAYNCGRLINAEDLGRERVAQDNTRTTGVWLPAARLSCSCSTSSGNDYLYSRLLDAGVDLRGCIQWNAPGAWCLLTP